MCTRLNVIGFILYIFSLNICPHLSVMCSVGTVLQCIYSSDAFMFYVTCVQKDGTNKILLLIMTIIVFNTAVWICPNVMFSVRFSGSFQGQTGSDGPTGQCGLGEVLIHFRMNRSINISPQ